MRGFGVLGFWIWGSSRRCAPHRILFIILILRDKEEIRE